MLRLGRHCSATLALAILGCAGLIAADQPLPFALSDWKVQVKPAAEGTQPRTFLSFQFRNTGDQDYANLVLTAELRDPATSSAQSSDRKTLATVAAGSTQTVQLAIPAAVEQGEYRLSIQYPDGGRTRQAWMNAGSATQAPAFAPATPPAAAPAQNSAATQPLSPGRWTVEPVKNTQNAKLTGTIVNNTGAPITEAAFIVVLTNQKQPVHTETVKLDGPLAAGATRKIEKTIPDCPVFDGIQVTPVEAEGTVARSAGLGEPRPDSKGEWEEGMQGGKQVEIGLRSIELNAQGEIVVRGKVRNGYGTPVLMQSIDWEFTTTDGAVKKAQTNLVGKLPAHTLSSVDLKIPGVGDFTRYNYVVNYRN